MDAGALPGAESSLSAQYPIRSTVYRTFRMFDSEVIFIKLRQ